MKIIDFNKKGNLVRFYLGDDDCDDYYGDDWNDTPYEHNAGMIYDEFVKDYVDVVFPFDYVVNEPCEDWRNQGNSPWCKDDMRDRKVPCIVASEPADDEWLGDDEFSYRLARDDSVKIYFGDHPNDLLKYNCIIIRPAKGMVEALQERIAKAVKEHENRDA